MTLGKVTVDQVVGWQHRYSMDMNLGKTPRDGEGLGGLASCSPWGHKESDTTWHLSKDKKVIWTQPAVLPRGESWPV